MLLFSVTSVACGSGSGGSSLPAPNPSGTECGKTVAGWQHLCYGDYAVYVGQSPDIVELLLSENDISSLFDRACCEGNAVQATADEACQQGCQEEVCAQVFAQLNLDADYWSYASCVAGTFYACAEDEPSTCAWYRVDCAFVSNELFSAEGTVPLEELQQHSLCGVAAEVGGGDSGGDTSDTGSVDVSNWSVYRVDLEPSQTSVFVDWASSVWGSGYLYGSGHGWADYHLQPCAVHGGDCAYLRHLIIYGGDSSVNGVRISNLVAQLLTPVRLSYSSGAEVDIDVGDLSMLVSYEVGGSRFAWEVSNVNATTGIIDPVANEFVLDRLEFSVVEGDIDVVVELGLGGAHR